MKRLLIAVVLAAIVAPNTGCCLLDKVFCHANKCCGKSCGWGGCGSCGDCAPAGCNACGGHGCGLCARGGGGGEGAFVPGPLTAQTTYPYYTTRGPRDFLAKDPPSIGP